MDRNTFKPLWMMGLMTLPGAAIHPAQAAPQPAIAPAAWELDFEFADPQRIDVQLPGQNKAQSFWYMIYKATNNTGREIQFFPTFELVTAGHRVIPADLATHPKVFAQIKGRHRLTHPFLAEPVDALGRLMQGEDNTKASVAIWSAFDAAENIDEFDLFIGGLSGEVVKIKNPSFRPEEPEDPKNNPRVFVLRKTLHVPYQLPGNVQTQQLARPLRGERDWVMR
jgi:hypothetical protein